MKADVLKRDTAWVAQGRKNLAEQQPLRRGMGEGVSGLRPESKENYHFMKSVKALIWFSVLAISGLMFILWPSSHAPKFSPQSASHTAINAIHAASDSSSLVHKNDDLVTDEARLGTSNETANTVMAKLLEWDALTDPTVRDEMEEAIKAMVTDTNAGDIVRELPAHLLETPVGYYALERWADVDRTNAVEWVSGRRDATPFQIATVLRGWVQTDDAGMWQYVDNLPAGQWKETVLGEISHDAARNQNSEEAIMLLRQMQPGENQTQILEEAAARWIQTDPDSAVEWVGRVDDPEWRQILIGNMAIAYASAVSGDPQIAIEWAQQSLPAGDALDQTVANIMGKWVQEHDPATAAAWVSQLPEGSMFQAALNRLIDTWQEMDSAAAATWVKSLPDGSLQNQAADDLAKACAVRL